MDLNEYRDIFISEAQEHLGSMNAAVLQLEKGAGPEALSELFRSAHTLKGMAATMGFDAITELTHQMEDMLDQLRASSGKAAPGFDDLLFACIDHLSEQIAQLSRGETSSPAPAALEARLKAALQGQFQAASPSPPVLEALPVFEQAPVVAPEAGTPLRTLKVTIDRSCTFRGVRAFMAVRQMEKMGKIVMCRPGMKQLETGSFDYVFEIDLASHESVDALRKACLKVMEVADCEVRETAAPAVRSASEAAPQAASPARAASPIEPLPPFPDKAAMAPQPAPATPSAPVQAKQSVRVGVERLDNLMNLVGELVTHRIRLAQIGKERGLKDLSESLAQLERVVNELQEEVMSARMVPVDHVFNRFPRMVRDLSHDLGKDIDFILEGKEIELDRTVLEEVSDPLVHILRNAVDHGIEPLAVRMQHNKPARGLIKLRAQREKAQVLIEVSDDGGGIDPVKLRAAAISKGFLTASAAEKMGDAEALQLIFAPGFSTAEAVTSVSGRGVGLDVVKSKVEGFGGVLRLESTLGKGTRFSLRLPLTLAIIQALLVRAGGELYAMPVANTVEAVDIDGSEIKLMQGREVLMLRGQILPVLRLGTLLGVPNYDGTAPLGACTVLVIDSIDKKAGLVVDAIVGQQEIAIKSLGKFLKSVRGFGGVTVLGDGTIALILDAPSLI
jgi:two-component system chemotaxis sensor kinase CheA